MENHEILAVINDWAGKALEVGDFGESILVPDQAERFIRIIEDNSVVLGETRRLDMETHVVHIDRTGFQGRVLRSGSDAAGNHRDVTDADESKPDFFTNKLIANEHVGLVSLRDRALRRNLERGNFENTLLQMFGEASSRDLEEYGFAADTDSADPYLGLTNGWCKLAAGQLYGETGTSAADVDPNGKAYDLFQAALETMPKKYLTDPSEWRFYVTWDVEDGYRNDWIARHGANADAVLSEGRHMNFKGIPIKRVPMLERSSSRKILFSHPDNMVWGVFHEVTVEPEREAKKRKTDFVLTTEPDMNYEDENAAVCINLDEAKAA